MFPSCPPAPENPVLQRKHPLADGMVWCVPFQNNGMIPGGFGGAGRNGITPNVARGTPKLHDWGWEEGSATGFSVAPVSRYGRGMRSLGSTNDSCQWGVSGGDITPITPSTSGTVMIAFARQNEAHLEGICKLGDESFSAATNHSSWFLRQLGSDFSLECGDTGGSSVNITGPAVGDEENVLTFGWNDETGRTFLYHNGVFFAENTGWTGPMAFDATDYQLWLFGADSSSGRTAGGDWYWMSAWDHELTPAAIAEMYRDPFQVVRQQPLSSMRGLIGKAGGAAPPADTADKGWYGWRHA